MNSAEDFGANAGVDPVSDDWGNGWTLQVLVANRDALVSDAAEHHNA